MPSFKACVDDKSDVLRQTAMSSTVKERLSNLLLCSTKLLKILYNFELDNWSVHSGLMTKNIHVSSDPGTRYDTFPNWVVNKRKPIEQPCTVDNGHGVDVSWMC